MKVVLLAAGRSKRLKPIEDKNFPHFLGKPLIQHQLEQLLTVGLKEIIVVGGAHNLAALKKVMADVRKVRKNADIKVIEQKDLDAGMAGAVLSAEKFIKKEEVLVASANDVVEEEAYRSVLKASKDPKIDGLLLAKKVSTYFPGGYLRMKKGGLIAGIVEKPEPGKEPGKMVNLVVHFHKDGRRLIETIQKTKSARDDRYEVALNRLIKEDTRMKAVPYNGFWQPIKYPWHVLSVMGYFLGNIELKFFPKGRIGGKKVEIAKTATVRGSDVYFEEGVRVLDNAVIIGPAYIGKNTVIAANAMVRASNIGANCVIGFGTEVARSFLGDDVWTHSNYIGDSVIGNDVSFGAGTVTGNLRLDEGNIQMTVQGEKIDSGRNKFGLITGNHVRCGINTSFMPGVKIGNNTFVGAGIVVTQDIPDNKYVFGRTELIVKDNIAQLNGKKRNRP